MKFKYLPRSLICASVSLLRGWLPTWLQHHVNTGVTVGVGANETMSLTQCSASVGVRAFSFTFHCICVCVCSSVPFLSHAQVCKTSFPFVKWNCPISISPRKPFMLLETYPLAITALVFCFCFFPLVLWQILFQLNFHPVLPSVCVLSSSRSVNVLASSYGMELVWSGASPGSLTVTCMVVLPSRVCTGGKVESNSAPAGGAEVPTCGSSRKPSIPPSYL